MHSRLEGWRPVHRHTPKPKRPDPTKPTHKTHRRTTHPTRVPPPPLRPRPRPLASAPARARTQLRDEAPRALPFLCALLGLLGLRVVVVHSIVDVAVHGGLDGLRLVHALVLVPVFVLRGVILMPVLLLLLEMPLVPLVPLLLLSEILLLVLLLLLLLLL